jgi:hypothetical protein
VKVEPFPTKLSAHTEPPCASTMRLQTAKPNPIPFDLVMKRGGKRKEHCELTSGLDVSGVDLESGVDDAEPSVT